MTSRELWDRYRAWLIDLPELGVRLDVSRMGLPADYLKSMEGPMLGAFDAMDALEEGAIANPDEDRMVGHYWLRAPDLAPSEDIRNAILETGARVRRFAADIHAGALKPPRGDRFSQLLVVGIGGSALGPQFLADALGSPDDLLAPHFLDNTDPDGFDRVLGALGDRLAETLVVTISKSGGTPETRNGMLEVVSRFRAAGLDPGPCCVAITQDGSKLDAYAEDNGFLARFPMWDWVGGRTSVMSAVGVLPAAIQGVDVDRLLDGAARMDRATRERRIHKNPAALLALAWYHAGDGRGARDMVVLPYKDRLALFSRYLQQLVMESLGKERDLEGNVVHQGISVYGNKGSTDQHAYVQQLRDGVPNFFASFLQVLKPRAGESLEVDPGVNAGDYLNGFLLGTRQALHENGRGSLTVTLDDVSPSRIGMLIALYERTVGLYASLVAVNAYNQPGVEAGKRAASGILELQRRIVGSLALRGDRGATCAELAALVGAPDEEENIFHILEHLAADPGCSIVRTDEGGTFDATYRARP